jgi:parallel beta-helix repeat protein
MKGMMFLLLAAGASAATLTVDDDGPADFAAIQPAIDAAAAGDTVYVKPGAYRGPIVMKDDVDLLGYGPHVTTIDGRDAAIHVVSFNGFTPTVLSGFRIIGSITSSTDLSWNWGGVYVEAGPITIRNNIIENNHAGIAVETAGRPTIINNTIVHNHNGVIFAGTCPPAQPGWVADVLYLYSEDLTAANDFASLLDKIGLSSDLVPVSQMGKIDFRDYRLIIASHDSGYGYSWYGGQTAATNIRESGTPVIGLGIGGSCLFEMMGLSINYGNAWTNTSQDGLYAPNPEHPIFNNPNIIEMPRGNVVKVYNDLPGAQEEYAPYLDRGVALLGRSPDDLDHYPLVQEGNHLLWGFFGRPKGMSASGVMLFENAVRLLLTTCYQLPSMEVVALGAEPPVNGIVKYHFRVSNWADYPDLMFESSPDLPACGLNNAASRTWVDIFDATGQQIYGYCNLSSAENLRDLWFPWPADQDPPYFYVRLHDRRCDSYFYSYWTLARPDWFYTHTILNNIIASNTGSGIFYYNFQDEGRILYNDAWGNGKNYHDNCGGGGGHTFVPQPGTGQISADPLFADGIYHLGDGSPCRNTGHPGPEYFDPDGTRNDMGAYGGPSASGQGLFSGSGFIFTSVGNIPTSEIVQNSALATHGLADVSPAVAGMLGIPAYDDAPFGGGLYINGLFGDVDIANGVRYYQILMAKWVGGAAPAAGDYAPLHDSLYKVKYTPQWDGTVLIQYINLGAKTIMGMDNIYELTYNGWWSNLDLRIIWDSTQAANGKYTLTFKAFRENPMVPGTLLQYNPVPNTLDHLTLIVNNTYCDAVIHNVKYEPTNPNYVWAKDGEIPECGMIDLLSDTENLRFTITANHPDGYMRYWVLDALYGKNQYAGWIAQSGYPGVAPPNNWPGVVNTEFDSSDGAMIPWQNCAYQFRLRAYSRITNGFGYLDYEPYADSFSDHYYIKVGDCAWCGGADINRSGRVDLEDFARLASQWLRECGPVCEF